MREYLDSGGNVGNGIYMGAVELNDYYDEVLTRMNALENKLEEYTKRRIRWND